MNITNVFRVILRIKIYYAQTRLCNVIVVNRRCDVSNAILSEMSMVENWSGMKTAPVTILSTRKSNNNGTHRL